MSEMNKEAVETASSVENSAEKSARIHGRLALNPEFGISKRTAWSVLAFAAVAVAFYVVGQTTPMWGLGATVRIVFADGTTVQQSYEPYQMSLFFSLQSCIKTGLVPEVILGVILFFFSGVWPHAKISLMLYCWFGDLSHRFRHIVLYWIGVLGKYSFLDPLVVAVLMVAFTIEVTISSGDTLFDTASQFVLNNIDTSSQVSTIDSMSFALDIVSFKGIYFFCGGVWLSLILGFLVEHFHREVITRPDINKKEVEKKEGHNKSLKGKIFWFLVGISTLSTLGFLVASIVVPLFEKSIDGVLPFLFYGFGWIDAPGLAPVIQEIHYGTVIDYVTAVQGTGAKFMAATIIIFVLAMPFMRAPVLDLLLLPESTRKKFTSKLYFSYSLTALFDSLAVFLLAVIVVHFEIDAIAEQIQFPFCGDVAEVVGIADEVCPNLGSIGILENNPMAIRAAQNLLSQSAYAQTFAEDLQGRCDELEESSASFNLADCISINLDFLGGMWCVAVAVILLSLSSMIIAYPVSIELYGKRFFEAPLTYIPGGWCCCMCLYGTVPGIEQDDTDAQDKEAPEGDCSFGLYACSQSMKNCCWCCKKRDQSNASGSMS